MDMPKIDFRYLKEAFKEPLNFWGMAGFAIAAAYVQDVTPLLAALAAEAVYLAVVPATPFYRRLVERREKERAEWIDADDKTMELYGGEGFPTNAVVDRDGNLRYAQSGYDEEGLVKVINQLLGGRGN